MAPFAGIAPPTVDLTPRQCVGDAAVDALADFRSRGVVFEEYTEGPLTTTGGIAPLGPARGAWFKDPDGNVIGLRQGPVFS